MKNPNNHNVDSSANLRRTTYDLSHSKHMSGEIGKLYPVLCEEVNPGETFHWSPNFNFRFAPTAMPIQTRIKCVVDYFFIPYKAVWKNQNAFFAQGMNNGVTPPSHPWLKMTKQTKNIGSNTLGDYLGVPSSINTPMSSTENVYCINTHKDSLHVTHFSSLTNREVQSLTSSYSFSRIKNDLGGLPLYVNNDYDCNMGSPTTFKRSEFAGLIYTNCFSNKRGVSLSPTKNAYSSIRSNLGFSDFKSAITNGIRFDMGKFERGTLSNDPRCLIFGVFRNDSTDGIHEYKVEKTLFARAEDLQGGVNFEAESTYYNSQVIRFNVPFQSVATNWYDNALNDDDRKHICMVYCELCLAGTSFSNYTFAPSPSMVTQELSKMTNASSSSNILTIKDGEDSNYSLNIASSRLWSPFITYDYIKYGGVNDDTANTPYIGDPPKIALNALPWRAYECCYNYWYRNRDIDPLLDRNGHRVVDQFLLDSQMSDGADTGYYPLRNALLEKDMFTSCFTEPLVNYNPLIGIRQKNNDILYDFATSGGVVTMSTGQSGIGKTETADGHEHIGAMITSYGEGIPQGDLNVFKDIIATGITNQDIYSAQCLQRWISNKVQKGYNFSEQQMAQFGVNSKWNPLTSPIYLGGTAEWINNGVVCNTARTETSALGELGGMPSCISSDEKNFSFHANDRGIIMGILRIVPIPIYSQAIHKFLTKQNYTDYFIPEFDNKGYEAIPKGEVVPYLACAENKQNEAFGYQVPWYDYKSSYDTISGDMRTNFNDSVLMRDFGTIPELSKQFIECRAQDYNNVFEVTKQSDKFIGEIFHNLKAERIIGDYQSRVFANVH